MLYKMLTLSGSMLGSLMSFAGFLLGSLMAVAGFLLWVFYPKDRHRSEQLFTYSVLPISMAAVSPLFVTWMSHLRPDKLDLYIYRIDQRLFGEPSFAIGRFVLPHPWMVHVLALAYDLISVVPAIVAAIYIYRRPQEVNRVVITFFLCFFIAPIFYYIAPVCGPIYAFPSFPQDPGRIVAHPIALIWPPNGMPSIHTATALLAFWFLRKFRRLLVVGFVYLVLIVLSTMAGGQHYVLDLIMAVPYTAMLLWVTNKFVPVPVATTEEVSATA